MPFAPNEANNQRHFREATNERKYVVKLAGIERSPRSFHFSPRKECDNFTPVRVLSEALAYLKEGLQ